MPSLPLARQTAAFFSTPIIVAFEPSFSVEVRSSRLSESFRLPARNFTLLRRGRYANATQLRSLLKSVHDWWTGHCGDDVPDHSTLDPFALKATLPYLLISDVEPTPFRVRYRLVGTKVIEATGLDFTGRYLGDLVPGDPDEPWMSDYRRSFDTRTPVIGESTVQMTSGASYHYEFGIFPVRNGGPDIVQFVGVEDYFDFSLVDLGSEPWLIREQQPTRNG